MSVHQCPFPNFHGRRCLVVVVEGGRPTGYHALWGTLPILVCPHSDDGLAWLTPPSDPASPQEVVRVMAEIAHDPFGQQCLADWWPKPTQEDVP